MMKKLISITYIVALVALSACNDLVDGLNENPNSPTSAPFQNVLTGAEVGNIIFQTGEAARRAGIFCGYYTGIDRQHLGFSNYSVTTDDFNGLWNDGYVNTLRNLKVAESFAIEEGLEGISVGITQVLQALTFGTMTSLWGAIPFDEAVDENIENPRFEDQVEVYGKVQLLLDQAIENLALDAGRPADGADIYFNGDPNGWIATAYTLKARYYMHTRQYDLAYAAAQNGISSLEESMYSPHGSGLDENNLNYQFFEIQSRAADLVTSDFMSSLVIPDAAVSPDVNNYRGNAKTNETGRSGFYFRKTSIGIQPNTEGLAAAEASAPIVTYQENLLILAEAGLRSGGFDTGLDALNGFRAFMASGGYLTDVDLSTVQYDAYVAADFANGGIENPDNISQSDALLREILEERYITLFSQIEGFADTRRTQSETTVRVPVSPNSGSELPQRFIYPQSEIDRNENTPEVIPGLFDQTEVNL